MLRLFTIVLILTKTDGFMYYLGIKNIPETIYIVMYNLIIPICLLSITLDKHISLISLLVTAKDRPSISKVHYSGSYSIYTIF